MPRLWAAAGLMLLIAAADGVIAPGHSRQTDVGAGQQQRTLLAFPTNPWQVSQGLPRSLAGTAWKIQFPNTKTRTEVTGNLFLFCRSGRWQFAGERYGKGPQGRYEIKNGTLITVAEDGLVARYAMQWQPNWLDLREGNQLMRLHYHGTTTC